MPAFFPQANGHADRIENIKPMFVEPRGKGTFTEVSAADSPMQNTACTLSLPAVL